MNAVEFMAMFKYSLGCIGDSNSYIAEANNRMILCGGAVRDYLHGVSEPKDFDLFLDGKYLQATMLEFMRAVQGFSNVESVVLVDPATRTFIEAHGIASDHAEWGHPLLQGVFTVEIKFKDDTRDIVIQLIGIDGMNNQRGQINSTKVDRIVGGAFASNGITGVTRDRIMNVLDTFDYGINQCAMTWKGGALFTVQTKGAIMDAANNAVTYLAPFRREYDENGRRQTYIAGKMHFSNVSGNGRVADVNMNTFELVMADGTVESRREVEGAFQDMDAMPEEVQGWDSPDESGYDTAPAEAPLQSRPMVTSTRQAEPGFLDTASNENPCGEVGIGGTVYRTDSVATYDWWSRDNT